LRYYFSLLFFALSFSFICVLCVRLFSFAGYLVGLLFFELFLFVFFYLNDFSKKD